MVVSDALKGVELLLNLVALSDDLIVLPRGLLKLPCHVIDVPLQSQDLLDIVLFLLLVLSDLEGGATDLLLGVLYLSVQVLVLGTHRLHSVLKALNL